MENNKIDQLLELAIQKEASDLHLVVGRPPILRVHGDLMPNDSPDISEEELNDMLMGMLDEDQKKRLIEARDLDFSYAMKQDDFQFRFNITFQKGGISATVRITSSYIPTRKELGLPPAIDELTKKRKGLILLAGTAGSGKSTTLNYIINCINSERKNKIITIEDPIEFNHKSKESLIIQREVGKDTHSFGAALKYALRQDPDVVVVGEMRDLESISMALTTAETGHLVISTVHAPDAVETINRIIDIYPTGMREQIYVQMAENLIGIIGQMLVPSIEGGKRVLVTEVLVSTLAIRNMIRRGALQEVRGQLGMEEELTHTYEQCLSDLAKQNVISEAVAREYSKNLHLLKFGEDEKFGEQRGSTVQAADRGGEEEEEKKPLIFKKEKVLIVEENEKDREGMTEALKLIGHEEFIFAEKGKEVMGRIEFGQPGVVVMDLGIPDMDSFELCRTIRDTCGDDVKIVLITGLLKATDSENAKNAKANDFVVKTSDYGLLSKRVKELCMVEDE